MQAHETLYSPYFKYGTKNDIVMIEKPGQTRPLLSKKQKMCQFSMIIAH